MELIKKFNKKKYKHGYEIYYTDCDNVTHYILSKRKYETQIIAKNAGDQKIKAIKKEFPDYTNFICKLRTVVEQKEFNKIKSATLKEDEEYEKKWNIIRKFKKYSIDEVLSQYTGNNDKINFDGDLIPMGSHRYANFKFHGITCMCCGIVGQYFRKERHGNNETYHFNLYALDNCGNEVLMTKDHVLAKSTGGPDDIDNYQPLCEQCNKKKGAMTQDEFMELIQRGE